MRFLTLNEYRTVADVPLTTDEVRAIQAVTNSIGITPSRQVDGCYDLTPGSHVGGIQLETLSITIQPKLPIERLLFLIGYTLDRQRWQETDFDFVERPDLLEAIIPGFVSQVRRAINRGVLQGYRSEEDALQTVRGRIRFDDQIRNRYGIAPPVEVRFDEFTEDIEENRLLKAAIHRLGRMRIRSERSRLALRAFDSALANVQPVEYHPRHLPEITWSRLNNHYGPAIDLAKLILRATTFDVDHGRVRSSAFLIDMNQLFEDFVAIALRESLGLSERTLIRGAAGRRLVLDQQHRVRLRPDLSWWEGGECVFAGDVKYKRVNIAGYVHADLYQILAYTIASGLPGGILIYAAGEADEVTHQIRHAGKTIRVMTLDLQGTPDTILTRIDDIAREVRRLRTQHKLLDLAAG